MNMSNFNVSNFFAERKKLKFVGFTVKGVDFELMALTSDQTADVLQCETSEEMTALAADYGLAFNRERVFDDEDLSKDIDKLWLCDELISDCDPSIKFLVGDKVCELSGLADDLAAMIDSEQPDEYIDGDKLPLDKSMGEIEAELNAANNIN